MQPEMGDLEFGLNTTLPLPAIGSFSGKRCILHFHTISKGSLNFMCWPSMTLGWTVLIHGVADGNVGFTLVNNLSGESHGQRNLAGYSPWGRKGLDTTEWLTLNWLIYLITCANLMQFCFFTVNLLVLVLMYYGLLLQLNYWRQSSFWDLCRGHLIFYLLVYHWPLPFSSLVYITLIPLGFP